LRIRFIIGKDGLENMAGPLPPKYKGGKSRMADHSLGEEGKLSWFDYQTELEQRVEKSQRRGIL